MVFWILVGIAAIITLATGFGTDWAGDTIGALVACVMIGAIVLGLFVTGHRERTDVPHADVSITNYTLAPGSQLTVDNTKVKFIYTENGNLKQYSEYADSVITGGGKTVQVTKTRYDIGTVVLPWGQDRVDTTVVVK